MHPTLTTTNPAVIFGDVTRALSAKWLASNLKYSLTHIYRMGADSRTNEETRRSPVCMLEIIISELMNRGKSELAIKIVDRLARLIGGRLVFDDVKPDKANLESELLDNFEAVAEYTAIARDESKSVDEKMMANIKAVNELIQDRHYLK